MEKTTAEPSSPIAEQKFNTDEHVKHGVTNGPFRLLDLPRELRDKVYIEMINSEYSRSGFLESRLACRQVYEETEEPMYKLIKCDITHGNVDWGDMGSALFNAKDPAAIEDLHIHLADEERWNGRGSGNIWLCFELEDRENCLWLFTGQGIPRTKCKLSADTYSPVFWVPEHVMWNLQRFTDFEVVQFEGFWHSGDSSPGSHSQNTDHWPPAPFMEFQKLL